MSRDGLKRTTPVTFAAGLAALLAAATDFTAIVAAQTQPGAGTPGPTLGVPEAPVGHRQPRPADLPPNVQREEQSNAPVQDNPPARRNSEKDQGSALGQIPSICVRC
jgi:hypothetical protein